MKLHDLSASPGSHKAPRRIGRGHGSGRGKTGGRGTKGQKARSGTAAWFEGGQTPLHIRTPKLHGFKNRFRVEYATVNLAKLTDVEAGTLITPDVLEHDGLVRAQKTRPMPIKILGTGDAPAGVTVHAHAFTRSALDKLAAAGSSVQRLSWPDNQPVAEHPQTPDGDQPSEPSEPSEPPAETPAEMPVEAPGEAPVEPPAETPAENAVDGDA